LGYTVIGATGGSLLLGFAVSGLVGSERRRTAASLQATNQRFDTALNSISRGLCLFDAAGRLSVVNHRFREIYGLAPEQVALGCGFRDVLELMRTAGHLPWRIDPSAFRLLAQTSGCPARGNLAAADQRGSTVAISYQPRRTADGLRRMRT
jgi:PAS domain-containing protein